MTRPPALSRRLSGPSFPPRRRRAAAGLCLAAVLGAAGCGSSSPYLGGEAQWMAATPQARADFVNAATAEDITLGEIVARYGPAEKQQYFPDSGATRLAWYGSYYSYSDWVAVFVQGDIDGLSPDAPVYAAANSDGMSLAAGEGRAAAPATAQAAAAAPAAAPAEPQFPNPIRPQDVTDKLAAAMAAFGRETRATPQQFVDRFGRPAQVDADSRLLASSGDVTLYYGSGYGRGRNIWVHFADGRYRRTMIHIPRGDQGPYERFF